MKTLVHRKRSRALICKPALGLAILALGFWSIVAFAQTGDGTRASAGPAPVAADKAGQKRQLIHELIQLTDAARLENIFSQQFISRVANAVAVFRPDMDPHTMAIIQQQARAVIKEHIDSGDALYSVLYPIYERHFNLIELNQLVSFYHSPLGQKLVRISPELLSESLTLGRQWALSLVPEIIDRVQTRLNAAPSAAQSNTR